MDEIEATKVDMAVFNKVVSRADRLTTDADELAACLRGAVTAMELIHYEERLYPDSVYRDLTALIERSKAALKEYDK